MSITKGLEVASLRFKPDNGKERRYIIVRKLISEYPKSGGKLLFDEPTYRYSAFVTNIELPVDQIYNIYNTRADCENRIKRVEVWFWCWQLLLERFLCYGSLF